MKLGRCEAHGEPFWAALDVDRGVAQAFTVPFEVWAPVITAGQVAGLPLSSQAQDLESLRLLAPVPPTAKVVAVGGTYPKHLAGIGLEQPDQPAGFLKPFSSLIGSGQEISFPPLTSQLDYEAELVAVVGAARLRDCQRPIDAVLGYTVGNDTSARDLQFGPCVMGLDMFSGK